MGMRIDPNSGIGRALQKIGTVVNELWQRIASIWQSNKPSVGMNSNLLHWD